MSDSAFSNSPIANLAKGMTDSAFVVATNREILEFNRPFTKLHKIDRAAMKDVTGNFCRKYVDMEICESKCIVLQCLESGAAIRFDEVAGKTSQGETLNLIVTAVPIRNEKQEIVAVLEMHRDVTDETQIHAKYKVLLDKEKRAKEELERLVEERTRQLRKTNEELKRTETQLVHSEKMSSLGQLVAGIAHELNNPINFIYGNSDIVGEYVADLKTAVSGIEAIAKEDGALSERFSKIMEEFEITYKLDDLANVLGSIRKGAQRSAEIIAGLRTFSRLDEAQIKETDLHQDLETTLMLLRNQYKDRVQVHQEYGSIPPISCYASQLNQVFMNLIYNAVQAIPDKGDIWIRTRIAEENVIVEIEDNGSGIAPEHIKKIFDPFFTTKDVGKGTGLGLSISYGIIERHGGKIDVESTVGKGTVFRVTIPIKAKPPKEEH